MSYPCPCCGYKTLDSPAGESFEICTVCFWQNNSYQLKYPNDNGGPNRVSLKQAQMNYIDFGTCEKEMVQHVRHPLAGEESDTDWQPLEY